jgi:fluoroquinolone transport system permease protein
MIKTIITFEIKNLIRERMTMIMLLWPIFVGLILKLLISREVIKGDEVALISMIIALLSGFAYGAMAGFSLLDDREDKVFESIQISPVKLDIYIWCKIGFIYILTVLASLFLIWFTGAVDVTIGKKIMIAVLVGLQMPIVAFIINSFAKNKVEGFVTMKATGFMFVFPVVGFYFLDAKEWLFSIVPIHWAAKAVQYAILEPQITAGIISMNLNFYQYLVIGLIYNLILIVIMYTWFKRKNDI